MESQNDSFSFFSLLGATSSALLMATFSYAVESQNCLVHAAVVVMENLHTQKISLPKIWSENNPHPEECRWVLWLVLPVSDKECALVRTLPFLLLVYYTCCKKT